MQLVDSAGRAVHPGFSENLDGRCVIGARGGLSLAASVRYRRAWWIVLGGFGLTLPGLVAVWLTFADGVARMPSRTSGVT
jgi:hypothetical protein